MSLRSPLRIFARKKTTMGVIRRCWIWLKRFRHRCGYGVHSPFAFDFLTNVVYERGEYYAYRALREQFFSSSGWRNGHALKCCKFLFRLANYVHPSVIRIYGGPVGRDVEEYLRAGCLSALFRHEGIGCDGEGLCVSGDGRNELFYISADVPSMHWMALADKVSTEHSVCLLCGIHRSPQTRRDWAGVKGHPRVTVSFDLYDYGILFFDSSKQNQHYIVNF